MSNRTNMIKAKGLVSYSNELSMPDGSLKIADNVNIDERGVITPRRGFNDYGDVLPADEDRLKQLMQYKDRIIRHYNSTLQFENLDGTFSDFSGSYSEVESGIRMKYQESNSNLYFNTDTGIKKISATSGSQFTTAADYIVNAGAVKAVDLSGKIVNNNDGFLPAQSKVAYRLVFGYTDNNNNVILGSPSSRFVLTNTSQDINTQEISSIKVTGTATYTNNDYILIYSNTTNYFIWFQTTGSDTEPQTAETLGKTGLEVDVQTGTIADIAIRITNAILVGAAGVLQSEIDPGDVTGATVLVTTVDNGNTTDIGTNTSPAFSSPITAVNITQGEIASGQPVNSELSFTLPTDIPTNLGYFYRVYRSPNSTAITGLTLNDIVPEDEMNLVIQTDVDLTTYSPGDTITETDITPESFRASGEPLYTNPISGQTILKANEQPPIAKDIALFNNHMFYANTKTKQKQQFTIVSVDDIQTGFTELLIGNSQIARSYLFVGTPEKTDVTVDTRTNTTSGDYLDINSANNDRNYRVWFSTSSGDSAPADGGRQLVRVSLELYDDNNLGSIKALGDSLNSLGDFSVITERESTEFVVDTRTNTTSGDYLDINSANDERLYRFWFSTSSGDSAPADGGRQLVRVSLEDYDDTIQGSLNALKKSMSILADFTTSTSTNNFIVTNSFGGITTDTTLSISSGAWAIDNIIQGSDSFSIVNDNNGPAIDSTMSITTGAWAISNIDQGTGEDTASNEVLLSGLASVAQSIDETARSLVRVINKDASSPVNAYYLSGEADLPGQILLENRSVEDIAFYVATNDATIQTEFNPTLPLTETISSITFETGSSGDNAKINVVDHGLSTGDEVFVASPDTTPAFTGAYTITYLDDHNFVIEQPITVEDADSVNALFWVTTTYASTNDESSHRLYYSKLGLPEAVPTLNYINIGPKDQPIERIIPLRDYLIVLKTDGVYLVNIAQNAANTAIPSSRLMDDTANIIAPDSAANLNNQIFCLTTQGITTITDSGASVISRVIEDKILDATLSGGNFRTVSVGVAYENDRAYVLWLPTELSDTQATQAFRYNTFERSWTRWTNSVTCALVKQADDKLYIGDATRPYLQKERKNRDRTDHADREFTLTLGVDAVADNVVRVSSVADLEVGDVLYQAAYLTISRYNQMLRKLDLDKSASLVTDYEDTFKAELGVNMQSRFQQLNDQLVIELGISAIVVSADIATQKTQWNSMVDDLNLPGTPTISKNYKQIESLIPYESIITDIDSDLNKVTLSFAVPFMQGDITAYKGIKQIIQWQPQHYGDPSALKQIREGTVIFDQNNFYSARLEFSSDASSSLVGSDFRGKGIAYFGYGVWNDSNAYWGGEGNDIPLRFIVPRDKQRCRYLTTRFEHVNARDEWRILGITAVVRALSSRAYR